MFYFDVSCVFYTKKEPCNSVELCQFRNYFTKNSSFFLKWGNLTKTNRKGIPDLRTFVECRPKRRSHFVACSAVLMAVIKLFNLLSFTVVCGISWLSGLSQGYIFIYMYLFN